MCNITYNACFLLTKHEALLSFHWNLTVKETNLNIQMELPWWRSG